MTGAKEEVMWRSVKSDEFGTGRADGRGQNTKTFTQEDGVHVQWKPKVNTELMK